jgi:hypothetical protein
MTINKLIKKLQKLEKECSRNTIIAVDWEALQSPDWTYSPIRDVEGEWAPLVDGDGCIQYTKNGREVMRYFVVLK